MEASQAKAIFNQLVYEIDAVISDVRRAAEEALQQNEFDQAARATHLGKQLQAFRARAMLMRTEWEKLFGMHAARASRPAQQGRGRQMRGTPLLA